MDNVHHIALYLDHFFHYIRYQEGKTGKNCPLIPSHQNCPPYLILSEKSGKQGWIIAGKSALCEDYNRLIPRVNNMLGFIFPEPSCIGILQENQLEIALPHSGKNQSRSAINCSTARSSVAQEVTSLIAAWLSSILCQMWNSYLSASRSISLSGKTGKIWFERVSTRKG